MGLDELRDYYACNLFNWGSTLDTVDELKAAIATEKEILRKGMERAYDRATGFWNLRARNDAVSVADYQHKRAKILDSLVRQLDAEDESAGGGEGER